MARPIAGYLANVCVVSRAVNTALQYAQETALSQGFSLFIFEGYRPLKATEDILNWCQSSDTQGKERFYPTLPKDRLFELGYIALRSSHTRGAAIDVTLIDANTLQELDMGTEFDYFGDASHTASQKISKQAQHNRQRLVSIMESCGFKNYEKEWWHFTLVNEPFPTTYFDFNIE